MAGEPQARHLAVDARMVRHSGIGTYLRALVPRIALLRPDWRITLIGDDAAMRAAGWDDLPNARLVHSGAAIYSLAEQLELPRRVPADAHALWVPHFNVPLTWTRRLAVTVHDVFHLAMPRMAGRLPHLAARAYLATVRRRASAILTVSEFTRGELARLVGIAPSRVTVAPNGVEAAGEMPAHPAPAGRPYVIFVGNVKPHKNLRTLVDAFGRLVDRVPHDLLIVGRREGLRTADDGLAAHAATLGARCRFSGEVNDAALRALVAGADALVMPSLYEGFGLPPLEAMALGTPTLVSRGSSLPEVCGDAALYCDPADAADVAERLQHLLGDAALRERLRAAGRRHAAAMSWDVSAATTAGALDRAVAT